MVKVIKTALLATILLLSSCQNSTIYHHYCHTSSDGWRRADTLTYDISAVMESGTYQLFVDMRMQTDYPYKSITLVVRKQFEDPVFTMSDTVSYNLVDERGNLSGSGVSTLSFKRHIQDIHFRAGQHGTIKLYHIMTRETLPGVSDVGLKLVHHPVS